MLTPYPTDSVIFPKNAKNITSNSVAAEVITPTAVPDVDGVKKLAIIRIVVEYIIEKASPERQRSHIPFCSRRIPDIYKTDAMLKNIVMLFIIPIFCTRGANKSLPIVMPPKNRERNIDAFSTVNPRYSLPYEVSTFCIPCSDI